MRSNRFAKPFACNPISPKPDPSWRPCCHKLSLSTFRRAEVAVLDDWSIVDDEVGDLKSDTFLPFLTGPKSVSLWAQGERWKQYNFFFQDEWKMRRNLATSVGVRRRLLFALATGLGLTRCERGIRIAIRNLRPQSRRETTPFQNVPGKFD